MSKDIDNTDNDNDEINFLDSLDPVPPTKGKSKLPPQLIAVPLPSAPSGFPRLLEFVGVALVSAAFAAGLVVWKLGPREVEPVPSVDAVALGRAFVPKLANALADGFTAGADAIKSGKSLGEGDTLIKATFHASRAKAFDEHAGKAIHELVADGQEINDLATRNAVVELFHGFAKGLRGAK